METLTITIERGGKPFPFLLCSRQLSLGPAGTITYYWMDGSRFRSKAPGANFRACVDHWWATMETIGAATEIDTEVNRVWAECYPLVNTARSLQDVYLDAHLVPPGNKTAPAPWGKQTVRRAEPDFSLPADEAVHLRGVAHTRDTARVRAELESIFLGVMPRPEEMPAYQDAAQAWIGNGVVALRTGGADALKAYVASVKDWMARARKRGGADRHRRFLNMFAYESKVAFYLCVANAWIDLIPLLRENHGLDAPSERFMRLWHHQNQPGNDDDAAPGDNRDAFCGQVLSLHPLSAFVMNDPAHLQALGAWLAGPAHDLLVSRGEVGDSPQYWDFVATVLIAAHEYHHVRQLWDQGRLSRPVSGDVDNAPDQKGDAAPPDLVGRLEGFAAARNIVCPECGGAARYVGHEATDTEIEVSRVDFRCSACGHPFDAAIDGDAFAAWLQGDVA